MAEGDVYVGISQTDIFALKGALLEQQQLLQKLYSELDVEREASSSAASEALSMILRLQGEKAAVEMEASQYKRMAEEKMCHAEESLEIFDELIYQKELEIASLEFQVQAYRYKLLSLGWTDTGMHDNRFPDNLFPHRGDLSNGETGFNQNTRRMGSPPPLRWRDGYQRKGILKSSSGVPSSEASPIIIEEFFDSETNGEMYNVEKKYGTSPTMGDLDSYWDQIRKLDDRVKEISQSKCPPREDKHVHSCSISSCRSVPVNLNCYSGRENPDGPDEVRCYQNYPNNASSCSRNAIQDIFEVPRTEESRKSLVKERSKSISKSDSEDLGSRVKDQSEWIKKMLTSLNVEAKPPRPTDNRRKGVDSAESRSSALQQLNERIDRLEKEIINQERSEIVREGLGAEELNLLKEIHGQLNCIQNEMRCWRRKEDHPRDETPVIAVVEAMLHFWL